MLEKLNLFGLHSIEDLYLVGLVSGEPICIVSHSGGGKTALVTRTGHALLVSAGVINAHTSDPQDWVGIPLPVKTEDGLGYSEMSMVKTPQSIADHVLLGIDEISRVEISNQSKLFSLIQSREVDGVKMGFKYLYAMMNPPAGSGEFVEYEGSEPLEFGLADRFALFLNMPAFTDMDKSTMLDVVKASASRGKEHNEFDETLPSMEEANRDYVDPVSATEFRQTIGLARAKFLEYMDDEERVAQVAGYITRFVGLMNKNKSYIPIDGRRAGMILRCILGLYALYTVRGTGTLDKAASEVVTHAYPNMAIGQAFDDDPVLTAHASASKDYMSTKSALVDEISSEPDKFRRVRMVIESPNLGLADSSRFIRDFMFSFESQVEQLVVAYNLFRPLGDLVDQQTMAEIANLLRPLFTMNGSISLVGNLENINEGLSAVNEAVYPEVRAAFTYGMQQQSITPAKYGRVRSELDQLAQKMREEVLSD